MSTSKSLSKEKEAINILLKKPGYMVLTKQQKQSLVVAFARKGKIVHKKAFDLIRISGKVDFSDEKDIMKNQKNITFIELKSTDSSKNSKFSGHYFGLTVNQMSMGQTFKDQYRFIFLDIKNNNILEMDLKGVYSRMKMNLVGHCTLD